MFQELLITDSGLTLTMQGLALNGFYSLSLDIAFPSAYWRSRGGGQCATLPPRWWSVKPMINVLRIPIGESSFVHLGFTGGTGPVRLACPRASDIRYQGFSSCLHFGRQGKPAALPHMSAVPLTLVSGRSPFVRLGRRLNFWGAGSSAMRRKNPDPTCYVPGSGSHEMSSRQLPPRGMHTPISPKKAGFDLEDMPPKLIVIGVDFGMTYTGK